MVSNDTVILAGVLDDWRRHDPMRYASDSDLFQQFCCEQVLKGYDLSIEQLEDGVIDGGDDGGIDGFFMFLDGEYIEEDTQMPPVRTRRIPKLEVFLFQAKNTGSFSEIPFDRARSTVQDLFNLSRDLDECTPNYNRLQ